MKMFQGVTKCVHLDELIVILGCWTITRDGVSNLVTIRSLLWPGFTSYHVANSNNFGYAYFGFGEKNNDLGFML